MISAASSNRAVLLCLLQSLAGVIFGWSNAEGSGLVSPLPPHGSGREELSELTPRSSRWRRTSSDSESATPTEPALSAQPVKVPSLVCSVPVRPSEPSALVPSPIEYVPFLFSQAIQYRSLTQF